MVVRLRLPTGGVAGHRTTACPTLCVIMRLRWFESTTQILVQRWRPRSWPNAMICGCRGRRCAAGCGKPGWLPRAERKRIQQPRHRREHLGELIQIDGSDHRWFEDRAPPCTLLVFVDDATSRLMAALAGKVVDIYDFPDGRLEILQPTPQDNQLISKRRVSQLHALT